MRLAYGFIIVFTFLITFCFAQPGPDKYPPFQLVSEQDPDLNGFPNSPKWGAQGNCGTDPNCDGFPNPKDTAACPSKDFRDKTCSDGPKELDTPGIGHLLFFCGLLPAGNHRVHGHVNWMPVTYDGAIFFDDRSTDEDYTWSIRPNGLGGITTENPKTEPDVTPNSSKPQFIHSECNGIETIDSFTVGNWVNFRQLKQVDQRNFVRGKRAVITGLLGLDSEHGGYSELHPIYAMGIEVTPSNTQNDVWTLFVRKNGNEGWCSSKDHPLKLKRIKFIIPPPPNSSPSGAELVQGTTFASNFDYCPQFEFHEKLGVAVIVDFPNAAPGRIGPVVEGDLHVKWISADGKVIAPFTPEPTIAPPEETPEFNPLQFLTQEEKNKYYSLRTKSVFEIQKSSPKFSTCNKSLTGAVKRFPTESVKPFIYTGGIVSDDIKKYYKEMLGDLMLAAPDTMKVLEKYQSQ